MSLLIGCGTKVSNTELEVYCPTPIEYSEEFNSELANEIEELPVSADKIVITISDYATTRDKLKNCEEAQK